MDPIQIVETFLQTRCRSSDPLLLGLSGGPDSLCLFYCLLSYQHRYGCNFHVAHIDHGWRSESQSEAMTLETLCIHHGIPFHLKKLNPNALKGNLEAACREERYKFFKELNDHYCFQGVLIGHQSDDQAETILKRVLEGSHWSKWSALKADTRINGMRILRPLLTLSKQKIYLWLQEQNKMPFQDPTNVDTRFLRARMRQRILPFLNQEFGKSIDSSLKSIGEEAEELKEYFDQRLQPLLDQAVQGVFGTYLDLQEKMPSSTLEIKYVLRLLAEQQGFFLSRSILNLGAQYLLARKANCKLIMGKKTLWIDRGRIFIPQVTPIIPEMRCPLVPGRFATGNWVFEVSPIENPHLIQTTSWHEGWLGVSSVALPADEYTWGLALPSVLYQSGGLGNKSIGKWWEEHKVPAFLRYLMPVIWKGETIYHEFLTGRSKLEKTNHQNWMAVKLHFSV